MTQIRPKNFPIVGIGASAGGVEALNGFFKGLPPHPGMAFVVVTHLNPERESLLHEIIGRYTDMPVAVAADETVVEQNKVYVLPADAILGIQNKQLQLRKLNSTRRERKPIDIFLSVLAKDQGEYAVGVILSGGDGDGTLGVKAIKERGGLTMAQISDGHGPSHPDMPESARSTGLVDFSVPVEEMGKKLVEYARGFELLDGVGSASRDDDSDLDRSDARQEICGILRNQIGHDFTGYKANTFLRRVQRRMQIVQLDSLEAYLERLRRDPKEVTALFRDLLINVTNFFRDAEAFETLSKLVIPKLFEGRGADDTIRIWVPGCATGEEVFSIAMLVREHIDSLTAIPRVQIFATDIDEHALGVARAARYPEALLDSVSAERRERFFTADSGSYQVAKDVRDLCIFSPHSVIKDPPFSRIDLVSCRNLLIYFGADVQVQVIPIFHYSLRTGGYLFLGTSESISQYSDLFVPLDKKHRIFRSRDDAATMARVPMMVRGFGQNGLPGLISADRAKLGGIAVRQMVDAQVLERHAPPHVIVNGEAEVVYYSTRTGKYLEQPPGAPSRQLFAVARRGLRLDLRTAFNEAVEKKRIAIRKDVVVETEDGRIQSVTITIEPIQDRRENEHLYLVLFSDEGPSVTCEEIDARATSRPDEAALQLERELRDTKDRLQGMIEEYETAVEELKSSNEELVSLNEELQSTNEELEASKEELQSLNEELHTVNAELNTKVEDLDRSNNDLQNLFDSTQVATVFLDRNLVIRSFTPAVSAIFNIRAGDRGRPLTDLSARLALPTLAEDLRSVFETGYQIERRIDSGKGGTHYLIRVLPYRDSDDKIHGVVLAFIDVTSLAEAEAQQRVLVAELNHRVKNMLMIAIALTQQGRTKDVAAAEFQRNLLGRLQALAHSYTTLSCENWGDLDLAQLIERELSAFGGERYSIQGSPLKIKPRAVLSLGMVLHELTTNAAKHGALSGQSGKVAIAWSVDGRSLDLIWREQGGPPTREPEQQGFGMRLVTNELAYSLSGKVSMNFEPNGLIVKLHCEL
jgi:two-component system CheB/CheR fusion protein